MCRRTKTLAVCLLALGAGLLISCCFSGWAMPFFLGMVLIAAGLLFGNRCLY